MRGYVWEDVSAPTAPPPPSAPDRPRRPYRETFIDLTRAKDRHAREALRAGRSAPHWRLRRLIENSPPMLRCPPGWKKVSVQGFPGVFVCVPPAQQGGELELSESYQRVGRYH